MTLGSLFDGIGGFPLAASRHGITPAWASEIEAAPIAITKRHFPEMRHLGSVLGAKGSEIEPVDIVTFGSPCQDLSVAGRRAGLDGERSGLFLEAVRIIKEMRDATNGTRPRYCVWENVPGAFSSNGGDDFRTVVEQIIGIVPLRERREGLPVPRPPGGGRWPVSGAVLGNGFSLAWRVLDAQYWGVPQRRRRIFLVADFGGGRAGEILFEPEGVHGRPAQGGGTGEGTAAGFEGGAGTAVPITRSAGFMAGQGARAGGIAYGEEVAPTLKAEASGTNQVPAVMVLNDQGGERMGVEKSGVSPTLRAETHGHLPLVAYCIQGNTIDRSGTSGAQGKGVNKDVAYTLNTADRHAVAAFTPSSFGGYREGCGTVKASGGDLGGGSETLVRNAATIRRLTPTECERLQGFPDGWTALGHGGKAISDSARYKALGNSVAVPCVEFIMQNMASV